MRTPLVFLLASALLVGCGGGDGGDAPTKARTKATTTPTPAFQREEYMGVSVLVPGDWKRYKPDDKSIKGLIYGPDDDKGSMGFFVSENNQNAADYIDLVILNPRNDGPLPKVRNRHKVKVPGIGTGIRMQTQDKPADPQERLFATSIDGLLVELTLSPGAHLSPSEVRRIMSSVRREP